jgi:lysozyme
MNDIRAQLIRDEGMVLTPYRDTTGKLTIGVGRNLDDVGISVAEAEAMLEHDLTKITAGIARLLPWTEDLDPARFGVLQNMAFNLGITGLLRFTKMLDALSRHDYATAANEMLDSLWAKQVGRRADRLATQMRSGEWE